MSSREIPPHVTFDSSRIMDEWLSGPLDPKLTRLFADAYEWAWDSYGWGLHLTSIWRSAEEDKALEGTGIHTEWRAIDVRTLGRNEMALELATWLNIRWVYDPSRPRLVPAYGKPHGSGPHLHLQVHPNTRLR